MLLKDCTSVMCCVRNFQWYVALKLVIFSWCKTGGKMSPNLKLRGYTNTQTFLIILFCRSFVTIYWVTISRRSGEFELTMQCLVWKSIYWLGYLDVSPGVGMRHLEEPEESRWTKSRHSYIRICVQSTHVYVYAKRWDEILDWLLFSFKMSFVLRKVEDVMTIIKPQSLTSVKIKDCTLRVPNKTTTLFLSEQ